MIAQHLARSRSRYWDCKYFDRQNVEIVKHLARSTASSPPTRTTTAHKTNPVNDQLFIVCKNNHNNLLAQTWYSQNLENKRHILLTPRPFLCPGNCSALTEAGGVHLRLFSQTAVYRAAATALLRRGWCVERKPTSWQRREIKTENRAIEVYVTIWKVKKVEDAFASLSCLNSIYFPKHVLLWLECWSHELNWRQFLNKWQQKK